MVYESVQSVIKTEIESLISQIVSMMGEGENLYMIHTVNFKLVP